MIIHYQNRNGEEKFIRNVIHLQNVGGGEFVALFISIHSPRVGRDVGKDKDNNTVFVFQSTLPVWGETYWYHINTNKISISIHSPRVGRDLCLHSSLL